jgi:D-cysteine desulfhydrase family pyridoxal phosphate-dependent enzyme
VTLKFSRSGFLISDFRGDPSQILRYQILNPQMPNLQIERFKEERLSLASQPRFQLATLPTPLSEARGLRTALGGSHRCPRILIKRDDLTGLALGGNKARKLEFLVGDAIRQKATVLVTSGATQSNHARMTAAAACTAGLESVLVLSTSEKTPVLQGNLLLDRLFGASIQLIPTSSDPKLPVADDEAQKMAEVAQDLARRGKRPYVIPIGGSNGVGALGYVAGTLELVQQLVQQRLHADRLYYASGSRGTQAGLELGARMFSSPYRLYGVAVSGGEPEKRERAARIANEAASLLNLTTRVSASDLMTDQRYIGEGYGIPTFECLEAIKLTARCEGILLDPVYTGKAMAALIDQVRRTEIDPTETVIFLHTGGIPSLFAHADGLGLD